jgi:hypothetical protein
MYISHMMEIDLNNMHIKIIEMSENDIKDPV